MSQENDYCKQALQSLTSTIGRKINEGSQKTEESFSLPCSYRVPEDLRKMKESAYTPRLVSIGPLHSKDKHLKSQMHDIKMNYVNSLLCRRIDGSEVSKLAVLEKCVEAMKLLVEDAKKCYNEEVDNLNEEMLVVDGCFILELLYRDKHGVMIPNDPVLGTNRMIVTVLHDLLVLENQLPFFVLEKLFHITVDKKPGLLYDYVISYFSSYFSEMGLVGKSTANNATNCCLPSEYVLSLFGNMMNSDTKSVAAPKKGKEGYYHILHILHDHFLPLDSPEGEGSCEFIELMPSALDLDYAGVKFVASTGQDFFKLKFDDAQSCLGICFRRARFEIPTLSVYDSTELFLRNLIAFEQCCPGVPCYFTSYAYLMDMLVNSAKDVKVLQKAGIIQNFLGADQEVSDLLNNLGKESFVNEFIFAETCKQANKYSKRYWPATVAHVRRNYFANPWTFIAFCVAFVAFVITITQFARSFFK
ncbi:UPF0481 protein At3g47200-like [Actinidia eriantha]|uniref:UPF0481 protein At3g47200-like n=1 Tax=Actinidia eriantha TaxID=165200 RepID=UPI002587A8B6|nr:UPF0481 protein At3g47200-like [Actinidia eriantha]